MENTASFSGFDRRAKDGAQLNVVFMGGSLTWGANSSDPQRTSYRGLMCAWLREHYPKASFAFHDAAIGGTGSKPGLFRVERDVLARKPDLVFLDYTVNDDAATADPNSLASYEGILRRLIEQHVAVEQVFLCFRDHFEGAVNALALPRYVAHRKISEAYGTAGGDGVKRMHAELRAGADKGVLWPWEGSHPDDAGYRIFFEAVRDGFMEAVAEKRECRVPEIPVFSDQYRNATRQVLVSRELPEGWVRAKTLRTAMWFDGQSSRWMDDVAMCKAGGNAQPLKIEFEGTMVGIFGERNKMGPAFKVKINGELLANPQEQEVWSNDTVAFGGGNLFSWIELTDRLSAGRHTLEIEPIFHGPDGELRIESVCSAGI